MESIYKFILCLVIVVFIYIVISYLYDDKGEKSSVVETLVNIDYDVNRPYNRGMGYPDIRMFAPLAYEKMGNTIRYPNKIDEEQKRQSVYDELYGEGDESFEKRQVLYELNDTLYDDRKIYQDMMYFNSASNAIRNFNNNSSY